MYTKNQPTNMHIFIFTHWKHLQGGQNAKDQKEHTADKWVKVNGSDPLSGSRPLITALLIQRWPCRLGVWHEVWLTKSPFHTVLPKGGPWFYRYWHWAPTLHNVLSLFLRYWSSRLGYHLFIYQTFIIIIIIIMVILIFFFAEPSACESSWARDRTHATAAT